MHYEKFADGTVKCIEDEIPFELPEGWEWCRGHSCFLGMESTKPDGEFFEYIDIDSIDNKKHCVSKSKKILVSKAPSRASRKLNTGSVVFSMVRPYLENIAYIDESLSHCIASTGFYICNPSSAWNAKFLFLLMTSNYVIDGLNQFMKGDNSPSIKQGDIENWLYPIPPLNEQNRIYNCVSASLLLHDNIVCEIGKLTDTIASAKSRILDLAIRGKLVPQDPNDEAASVLLERIRAEKEDLIKQGKIKRDKKESIIFKGEDNSYYEKIGEDVHCIDEEIPFEIPNGWELARLGSILQIERGGSPRPIKSFITNDSNGISWIKIGDVEQGGKYVYQTNEKIKPDGIKKSREVFPGDFLLTNSMSFGRPYITKIYGCIHDGWLVLRNPEMAFDVDYLYFLLSSTYAYNQFVAKASGSTVENLNIDKVAGALVPIPPLMEQTLISDKITYILGMISAIEASLN